MYCIIRRVPGFCPILENSGEEFVYETDNLRRGTETGVKSDRFFRKLRLQSHESRNIRISEQVNRLFGIADDEEPVTFLRVSAEFLHQPDKFWIIVLHFIHQNVPAALRHRLQNFRMFIGQQSVCQFDEIVEIKNTGTPFLPGNFFRTVLRGPVKIQKKTSGESKHAALFSRQEGK